MFSCVKVLCVTTITKNITKKKFKERDLLLVAFFKQLWGVVTMALNTFTTYTFFFNSLSVRS